MLLVVLLAACPELVVKDDRCHCNDFGISTPVSHGCALTMFSMLDGWCRSAKIIPWSD